MLIDEIIRSCVLESVAQVAVACIGCDFAAEINKTADEYGLTTGAFVALSVERFARRGDKDERRAVEAAMKGAQEPILAGLHHILCIMLAAGVPSGSAKRRGRPLRFQAAQTDPCEIAARHETACDIGACWAD